METNFSLFLQPLIFSLPSLAGRRHYNAEKRQSQLNVSLLNERLGLQTTTVTQKMQVSAKAAQLSLQDIPGSL